MHTEGAKCSEETIKFDFGLGVVGLALVPGDGAKPSRVAFVVCTFLGEDPAHAVRGRINSYENRVIRRIVDRSKGRGMDNSILEGLHSPVMVLCPDEGLPFASEVDQGPCES